MNHLLLQLKNIFFLPQKHCLKVYLRDPNSYTALRNSKDYLLLSPGDTKNSQEISKKDAQVLMYEYTFKALMLN